MLPPRKDSDRPPARLQYTKFENHPDTKRLPDAKFGNALLSYFIAGVCSSPLFASGETPPLPEPAELMNQQHCMFCRTTDAPLLAPSSKRIAARSRNVPDDRAGITSRQRRRHGTQLPVDRDGQLSPEDARPPIQWVQVNETADNAYLHRTPTRRVGCVSPFIPIRSTALTPAPTRSSGSAQSRANGRAKVTRGLDLPKWGSLQRDSAGPLICGPAYTPALCLRDGLDLDGFAAPIFTVARSSALLWLMQLRVGDR